MTMLVKKQVQNAVEVEVEFGAISLLVPMWYYDITMFYDYAVHNNNITTTL